MHFAEGMACNDFWVAQSSDTWLSPGAMKGLYDGGDDMSIETADWTSAYAQKPPGHGSASQGLRERVT